jgi:hypothetical protein
MKYRLLLALLLIFSVLQVKAQRDFKPELYVGVGGGALSSSVDFAPQKVFQDMYLGYFGGVAAKYIAQKNMGIVAELNYTQRGWKEKFRDNPEFAYTRTLNYVEIPFMTHVYAGKKNMRFIFNAGPQIGVLINDNQIMSNGLADNLGENKNTMQYMPIDSLKRFDYGLVGGLGLELKTNAGVFDLEGRYYFGLNDLFPNRRGDYFARSAHRIIEAKLTYYIKLK